MFKLYVFKIYYQTEFQISFTLHHGPRPLHMAPRDKGCRTQATLLSRVVKQNANMISQKVADTQKL